MADAYFFIFRLFKSQKHKFMFRSVMPYDSLLLFTYSCMESKEHDFIFR